MRVDDFVRTVDAIKSEWWAPSDQNAWTASLGICTEVDRLLTANVESTVPDHIVVVAPRINVWHQ
jgi:hypothetical protein